MILRLSRGCEFLLSTAALALDGDGKVIAAWGPRTDVKSIKGEVLKAIEKLKLSRREL